MYEKFADLLAKSDMTVYEVARQTGIPQSTFAMWKTRGNILNALYLQKIARFFGVTIEELLPEG